MRKLRNQSSLRTNFTIIANEASLAKPLQRRWGWIRLRMRLFILVTYYNLDAVRYLTLNPLKLHKRTLPMPLCYLWDSELEVIEEGALPSRSMIMAHNPHARIVANLGEDYSWMLQVYLAIQKIVHNEIMYSF